eukprot:TRINITY_DN76174_c0_g1_i1.p1 TRINITY_DN76174_c0_g1~~TRINITY_DN76174_c0_g1_i1.p1  ORF type:complete len:244 (+),score=39.43 TRINITY_DN76174_c0_g1_i1:193-924(+)
MVSCSLSTPCAISFQRQCNATALLQLLQISVVAMLCCESTDVQSQSFGLSSNKHESEIRVSSREALCRSYLGYWAERGTVSLDLVCRQAYSEAACRAATLALGGDWPEQGDVMATSPTELAAIACKAVEKRLNSKIGIMLRQTASSVQSGGARRSSVLLHAKSGVAQKFTRRSRELPEWVMNAPVIYEDPEVGEMPQPLEVRHSTWDGPLLTQSAKDQLYNEWGGTLPPLTLPDDEMTTIGPQ